MLDDEMVKNGWRQKAVIKISSCQANDTSRWGIQQLGILFDSIFRLFSYKSG